MFCTKCGSILPENSKFCSSCGAQQESSPHADSPTKPERLDAQTIETSITNASESVNTKQTDSENAASTPNFSSKFDVQHRKNGNMKLPHKISIKLLLLAGAVLLGALLVVFILQRMNERNIAINLTDHILQEYHSDLTQYYDSILLVPYDAGGYSIGVEYSDITLEKLNSRTFDYSGNFYLEDYSSNKTYVVTATCTVYTNFFRSEFSYGSLTFKDNLGNLYPISSPDSSIVTLEELNYAYNSNQLAANDKYANQYLNVYGKISKIGAVSFDGTVTVELEYYTVSSDASFELFFGEFEFDAANPALYNLQVGDYVTLTGYLEPGSSDTYIYFTDASLYE